MSAEFTALFIIRDESSESKRNFSFWGTLGFSVLRFSLFFRSVFRFLCQKTSAFRFYCSLRFADFSFFRIWFSVFVENDSGFSLLLSNVVCIRFSVLAEFFGGLAILDDFFFSVLRFLIYPNVPLSHASDLTRLQKYCQILTKN